MARHRLKASCSVRLDEQGAILFLTFLMMVVLAGLALAVGVFSQNSLVTGKSQSLDKQAFYIAEAGLQRARQAIVAGTWTAAPSPGNVYTESFGTGEYQVTVVDNGNSTDTITSDGYVPSQTTTVAKRKAVASNVSVSTNLSLNPNVIASASSSKGSDTPDQAKDGNTSTTWQANTNGSGSWLALDFQTTPTLDKIVIKEDNNIDGLTIEWSDDSSSWTAPSGLSVVESPAKTWTATFTATSHRYFRSRLTSVPSNKKAAVQEMESYNTVSNTVSLSRGTLTTQW